MRRCRCVVLFFVFVFSLQASYYRGPLTPKIELPSLDNIATHLKMNPLQLKRDVRLLNAQLNGHLPASQVCARNSLSFCPLLLFLENYHDESRIEKKLNIRQYPSGATPHLNQISILQSNDYNYLTRKFTGYSKQSSFYWAEAALKTKTCPRNLSAALVRLLEEQLPDTQAMAYIEKLYQHASQCITPQDPHYEEVHMRQALLRYLWGAPALARNSALSASLAIEKKKPEQVLYWTGFLQDNPKNRSIYWKSLIRDYPLSYYSLEVWNKSNADPFQYWKKKEPIKAQRYIKDQRHIAQRGIFWIEALFREGFSTAATQLSLDISEKFSYALSPENVYYLALIKADTFSFLSASPFIYKHFQDNFRNISLEAIQLMFPTPYQSVFYKNKDLVDPFLLYAVARQESAFNPKAKSPANAIGLLQLLPSTAKRMNNNQYANLYDPYLNVRLGAKFLNKLIHQFDGVVPALAAYNAGPARIENWKRRFPTADPILFMDLIPYSETHNYVKSILRNHYWYENFYGRKKGVELQSKKI